MSPLSSGEGRLLRRRPVAAALLLGTVAALVYALGLGGLLPGVGGVPRARGEGAAGEPAVQTDASVPAVSVVMIGATPGEAGGGSDETWGIGAGRDGEALVRYVQEPSGEGSWSLGPGLQDETGAPLAGFELDNPQAFSGAGPSPLAGQMTPDGAGAMVGEVGRSEVLLVRDPGSPGNAFREVKAVPEAELEPGELLFSHDRAPLLAPLDEGGGHAGALIVPVLEHGLNGERWVLHWEGSSQEWKREPIEAPSGSVAGEFHVLGIGGTSPTNAWLLAQISEGKVALFRRRAEEGEPPSWKPVALKAGGEAGEPLQVDGEDIVIPGEESEVVQTQVLTVTERGVWIDGERPAASASTTIFYDPAGEGPPTTTSWCTLERSPPGTQGCDGDLPFALPTGPSRSLAWTGSSRYGERVITGLPEGVSLRLEGERFVPLLGLGDKAGAFYGAAFTNPNEGWLGSAALPEHVTLTPAPNQLTPWPAAFHHALLAIAPQPEAPVGALSSEAIAVGDIGEVARYQPGEGWLPETLFGPNGKPERPRLRAVAWPTRDRVYAVGDGLRGSQIAMWLWRGETGLWEPDPGEPRNFRGNLLGIAFDPVDPAIGYAVGQGGVLLRFGKSWTQDDLPAEPPCTPLEGDNVEEAQRCSSWADASFTSIAFAGGEAIVAYRVLPRHDRSRDVGGLIVNDGAGWHVDSEAAATIGEGVPWAVAGLPDGGAAFAAGGNVYEREAIGTPWRATPTPFPGGGEPGQLALFREGGALRVVAAGSAPATIAAESEPEAPPGSPPTLPGGYPLSSSEERPLLRQTATGWSDEEHELNLAREPEGNWLDYDTVYNPDAIAAVLVDPTGAQGWAVGGDVEVEETHGPLDPLDTAEVARYRESSPPPGRGTSVTSASVPGRTASFAFGGNAQCASPCAARERARVGPDVWLEHALTEAGGEGVQGFFYTGPRLPNPAAIEGKKTAADRIHYPFELERYADILASSPVPAYTAPTTFELDESFSEASFESAFSGLPPPLGRAECAITACPGPSYYAVEPPNSRGEVPVRVIVLDDSSEVQPGQESWLREQLEGAAAAGKPAIVVGNANLLGEIAEHNHPGAEAVASILTGAAGNTGALASAYFYDAPEENVQRSLDVRGGSPVPTFGSGTLGYVSAVREEDNEAFNGASGFLLGNVELATRSAATNQATVKVSLIPDIEELALEAKDGTLLHRSQSALFAALARRPRAGNRSQRGQPKPQTSLYIPIPSNCVGASCATAILPEYEFNSSDKEVGDFVEPNLASAEEHAVLLGPGEVPIPQPKSGLFCAYNKGETKVKISAGGLSYELPVTVQAGSVRRPCGTTHVKQAAATGKTEVAPPAPAPAPTPAGATPAALLPIPPPPVVAVPPRPVAKSPLSPFLPPPAVPAPVFAALLPPVPTPARPTPPSGTSPVTQPVEAAEKEEESEEATESVGNNAAAYSPDEYEPPVGYLLGLVVLAAFAGAAVRRPRRRGRREVRVAPATISTMRAQRRASRDRRPPW